jgi:hypothetical protein
VPPAPENRRLDQLRDDHPLARNFPGVLVIAMWCVALSMSYGVAACGMADELHGNLRGQITFRVSEETRLEIERQAGRARRRVGDFLRLIIADELIKRRDERDGIDG